MICDICGKEDVKIRYVTRSYGKEKDHLTPGGKPDFHPGHSAMEHPEAGLEIAVDLKIVWGRENLIRHFFHHYFNLLAMQLRDFTYN